MEPAGGGKARRARETGRLVDSTQAEDRRMIALVAARPLLYARSTLPVASYYSQVKQLWQEVADLMGWTVAEVRRKWSHIRNSYSRHLRNEMHGLRTGRGRMVSRWYLADDLEFLRQHMATDTRPTPTSQFSLVSGFPPSLLELQVGEGGAAEPAVAAAAWYAAPEPAPPAGPRPRARYAFEPDENAAYFHFFRAIFKDYEELTPRKQRTFRRKCLILLHGLVDGASVAEGEKEEEGGPREEEGEDTAMNLSSGGGGYGSDADSEREHKLFVRALQVNNCVAEPSHDDNGADVDDSHADSGDGDGNGDGDGDGDSS